jgi:hypothetical protein
MAPCATSVSSRPTGASVFVEAVAGFDATELEASLCRALDRAGLDRPAITLQVVDRLKRTMMGKRQRFVPLGVERA